MMTGVPTFTVEEARRLAEQHYGRRGTITELPSERDQNFLLVGDDGARFVLKVANANEHRAVLEGENHVMRRVEASRVCPWLVRTREGHDIAMAGQHHVRLVTALDGQTFGSTAWQTDDLRRDIGRTLGRFDEAMIGCDHPAFHRHFHWDLAHALDVVDTNLALVTDDRMRALIRACAERHRSTVAPALVGF
ncbi:MAG: phosphotransferase, partial [Acidobacteria bacterium]|nr:phosphotransferase [Acidobacteriota bacterium]